MKFSPTKFGSSRFAALVTSLAVAAMPLANAATAQAAGTVWQGMPIRGVNNSPCTASIANDHTAYTALHCGGGQWKVGDQINSRTGGSIGTIAALGSDLPAGQQLDVVKIDLGPGVKVKGNVGVGDSAALNNGDAVKVAAPGNRNTGTVTNSTPTRLTLRDDQYPSDLISTSVQTFGGNSGGALLNSNDELVGVLAGGNAKNKSYFTPINVILERLG
ncbi:trypsin-like serine protease [Corynebacterium lowii]|uniref:Serine protease n=1 Tax=Corynebacterium lowii TaxID=1544413 RepID=A0A0Q1AK17_9CORY|nr:trypsin-like serine protease [Corynebacterium lowii]KQB87252.1 Trypsin [Corynebacterium lowii]MDP9852161.1 hypothetical protein [Corynebacterium lowii]